jgi:hypothetical protein
MIDTPLCGKVCGNVVVVVERVIVKFAVLGGAHGHEGAIIGLDNLARANFGKGRETVLYIQTRENGTRI